MAPETLKINSQDDVTKSFQSCLFDQKQINCITPKKTIIEKQQNPIILHEEKKDN